MERAIWLSYKILYSDKVELNLEIVLRSLPTTAILQRLSYINSKLHLFEKDLSTQFTLFSFWLNFIEDNDQIDIKKRIFNFSRKIGSHNIMYFTKISSMMLAQKSIENINLEDRASLTAEEELLFLKAYFMANDILDEKQNNLLNPFKKKKCWSQVDIFIHSDLLLLIAQAGLLEYKNFVIELVNGLKFFKYIERSDIFSKFINDFVSYLGFDSWEKYLLRIADIYGKLSNFDIGTTHTKHRLIVYPLDASIISFFDKMSINFELKEENLTKLKSGQIFDFKIFREKPLYKIADNEYCFINLNFFIDKFFNSLIFQFYNYIHKFKEYKVSYQGFKGIYSSKFSEETLFFEVMDLILTDSEILKVKGTDYDYEFSDYYVRYEKNIYLFEFKNYLMEADIKHSYDFELIKNELITKYIKEQGGKQLLNTIQKIENQEIDFEISNLNFNKLNTYNVYPIIVFTDIVLNSKGLNYMINREFKTMLNHYKFKVKVKDLIMIDLNTLIEFQEIFINKKLDFFELLKSFLDSIGSKRISKKPLIELTSFDDYINDVINDLGIERVSPNSFEESLKELFR